MIDGRIAAFPEEFMTSRGRPSIFARHLPKSPKNLPGVEFADLEIAGPTERDRAGVAEGFPESLRALDRGGRRCASDGFTRDDVVTDVIERHSFELSNLGHSSAPPRAQPANTVAGRVSAEFFPACCKDGPLVLMEINGAPSLGDAPEGIRSQGKASNLPKSAAAGGGAIGLRLI